MRLFTLLKNIAKSTPVYKGMLKKTYMTNSAVAETDFNRMYFYQYGEFCMAYINLNVTNLPINGDWVQIGTVDLPRGIDPTVILTIPSQNARSVLLLQIDATGKIRIYNGGANAVAGWCRATAFFPIRNHN